MIPCFIVGAIYSIITLFFLPNLIEKEEGPSVEKLIHQSFKNASSKNYDLLILGNSGTYRGINPDILSIPSYNFSHDNDTYNQIYYKLVWLKRKNKKFKYLILGIDYFQFSYISDTRNYLYSPLFDVAYSKDYPIKNFMQLFFDRTNIKDMKRLKYLKNIFTDKKEAIFQKENGQYIRPDKFAKERKFYTSIKRLPIQEKYFKLILDICSKDSIEIFICMVPVRKKVMLNYTEKDIKEFNNYIAANVNSRIYYLNYSTQPGWNAEDYTDMVHLNVKAADKYSKQLNDTVLKIINNKD